MEAKKEFFRTFSKLKNIDITMLGGPMLAEVGKIKIGGKGAEKKSAKGKTFRLPEKYDHFIITTNFKDFSTDQYIPDYELMEKIARETNQEPKSLKFIPVTLLFDDPDLNFLIRFSCYKHGRAWCIGDGKRAFRLEGEGQRKEVPCPCQRVLPGYSGSDKCKVFGRLSVVIRGIERLGGAWIFRTTSYNSCRSIMSSMMFLRQLTGGILAGIPLILSIHPKTVITTKGEIQTIYIVALEFMGRQEELLEHSLRIRRYRLEYQIQTEMLEEQIRKSLSLPVAFEEDEKDIAEEFYPENELEDEDQPEAQSETQPQPEPQEKQEKAEEETSAEPEEPQEEREPTQSKQPEVLTLW